MQEVPQCPSACHAISYDPVPFPPSSGPVQSGSLLPPLPLAEALERPGTVQGHAVPGAFCSAALPTALLGLSSEAPVHTLCVVERRLLCRGRLLCCLPSRVVLAGSCAFSRLSLSLWYTHPAACLSAVPSLTHLGLGLVHLLSLVLASLLGHHVTAVHSFVSLEQDADVFQNFLQPQAVSFFGEESFFFPGVFRTRLSSLTLQHLKTQINRRKAVGREQESGDRSSVSRLQT